MSLRAPAGRPAIAWLRRGADGPTPPRGRTRRCAVVRACGRSILSSREAVDGKTGGAQSGPHPASKEAPRRRRVDNRRAAPLFSAIAVALPRLRFRSGIDNDGPFTDVGAIREIPDGGIPTTTLSTPQDPSDESWARPARKRPAGPVERRLGGPASGVPRGPRAS